MHTGPAERPPQEPACSSTNKERLAALRRYAILDTPNDRDFDDLCQLAAHICGAPVATIGFIDAERQWFKSTAGLEVDEVPLESSICRYTICEEEILVVENLLDDERFRNMSCCYDPFFFRFYAGVVIRSADGFPLGTVAVADRVPRQLDAATITAFKTLARQVTSLLESRRFETRLEEKNRLAELRASLSARLARSEPLGVSLQACAEIMALYFQDAVVRIWMLDSTGEFLEAVGTAGLGPVREGAGKLPVARSRVGQVYLSRQPQVLHLEGARKTIWEPPPVKGVMVFSGYPLIARHQTLGVLTLDLRETSVPALLTDLDLLAYLIAQGIETKRAEEDLLNRERIARFLAKASSDLAEVGDFYSTMQKIANSAVPEFSDWCLIFMTSNEVPLKGVAIAHRDPDEIVKMRDMIERYTPRLAATSRVEETGESELFEVIPDSLLQEIADDEQHLQILRSLNLISFISVALTRRGEIFGMMTFYTAESGRKFNRHHLAAAEDLARRAEVAIENANLYQQLQEADRSKDEFLATLAHELRNPLAPLSNAVEILKTERDDPEAHRQTCEMMARQLRHLVRLVDDLLDISRITHNRLELRLGKIPFSEIAKSVLETATPLVKAAHHHLSVELPDEPIMLQVDPARITQVISNLLHNAVKYTREGGEIAFQAWREAGTLCICVKDSGVGIEPEMLPRVFDLFTQVGGSLENAQGGMGIGLTLVRRLTELHGGSVEAYSEGRGKGSEFLVRLPILAETKGAEVGDRLAEREAPRRKLKILVVDDNRDSAVTLARLLARLGHDLKTAFDGPEAVILAAEFQPDVVFLDIGMPNLNGYDAARLIRKEADARGQRIVLMAMTGWGQESDLRRAKEAGFDQHLLKPLDFADVKRKLLTVT